MSTKLCIIYFFIPNAMSYLICYMNPFRVHGGLNFEVSPGGSILSFIKSTKSSEHVLKLEIQKNKCSRGENGLYTYADVHCRIYLY